MSLPIPEGGLGRDALFFPFPDRVGAVSALRLDTLTPPPSLLRGEKRGGSFNLLLVREAVLDPGLNLGCSSAELDDLLGPGELKRRG